MTLYVPSINENQVLKALGDFITRVLPVGTEVLQGQANRVPNPGTPDYVIMTPSNRSQLSTTVHEWDTDNNIDNIGRATALGTQLDFHGPNSGDYAQIVTTLIRDSYGVTFFRPSSMEPLYCMDPQQLPFINGQNQYEDRWSVQAVLQALPIISTPQEFADKVDVTLVGADLL